MNEKKPMSQFGIGPYYGGVIFALTLAGLILNSFGLIPVLHFQAVQVSQLLLGIVLMVEAVILWTNAVFTARIVQHVRDDELVTTGAYAWVRNPIYSAIMLLMWGLLLLSGNLLLVVLCPVYYLLLTVMVKNTEEKWLTERYGDAFLEYCKKVNRCIPWLPQEDCEEN